MSVKGIPSQEYPHEQQVQQSDDTGAGQGTTEEVLEGTHPLRSSRWLPEFSMTSKSCPAQTGSRHNYCERHIGLGRVYEFGA